MFNKYFLIDWKHTWIVSELPILPHESLEFNVLQIYMYSLFSFVIGLDFGFFPDEL